MSANNDIGAIILAGGKSSRMKTEKGLVLFKGKMLIEHVIDAVRSITDNIIIITSNPAYQQFGYPCYEDDMKEKGALGGIYTGLVHSGFQKNMVVGCDMPFLSPKVMQGLILVGKDADAAIAMNNGLEEPLCSLYDRSCIPHFKALLEKDQLKITNALQQLKTRFVSFEAMPWFTGNEFANINSEEELKKYR